LFGTEYRFFIPKNQKDLKFEKLIELHKQQKELINNVADKKLISLKQYAITRQLKIMADQVVQVRLNSPTVIPALGNPNAFFNMYKITNSNYSFRYGVNVDQSINIL